MNEVCCKYCNTLITNSKNKFCNHSCATSFNNAGVRRHGNKPTNKSCLVCGNEVDDKKFCSRGCKLLHNENKIIENLLKVGCDNSYNHHNAKRYLIKV